MLHRAHLTVTVVASGIASLLISHVCLAAPATQPAGAPPARNGPNSAVSAPATARDVSQTPAAPAIAPGARLLILPLSETVHAGYPWVSRAVQQDLLADLSQATRTRVDAPSSAVPASDPIEALKQARSSQAALVVYGQYQVVNRLMRFTGQVLDVQTGKALGGFSATGAVDNLFPLEDRVASQVLHALPTNLLTFVPPAQAGSQNNEEIKIPPAPGSFAAQQAGAQAEAPVEQGGYVSVPEPQYQSYTYPDYSPAVTTYNYYDYSYPYYWEAVPFYGPDLFYFYDVDRFHHHDWDRDFHDHDDFHSHGVEEFRRGGLEGGYRRFGGFSHNLAARPMPHAFGGGGFHSGFSGGRTGGVSHGGGHSGGGHSGGGGRQR